MAKGKNLNPADAHRKALRKKELKKNKEQRQKNRDFSIVKKDTTELEDDIAALETKTERTKVENARLSELKSELAAINKKKEEYVEEHPEQRKLVYASARRREQREKEAQEGSQPAEKKKRNFFNKNGLPRHPERSIYYDPVMNPFGMPPPGMPYVERGLLEGEIASDEEHEDIDDEVIMPAGPPPSSSGYKGDRLSDEDSDDDIPMPEGPPPSASEQLSPPLPPGPPPPWPSHYIPAPPPPGYAGPPFAAVAPTILPPPPPGIPPPPSGYPPFMQGAGLPPPPPLPLSGRSYPPPPPGFFPRVQSAASMQDPLSSIPHTTFQAHQANRQLPPPPQPQGGLNASLASGSTVALSTGAATVIAAPQLRDFKKESTAFVPTALKRKKAAADTVRVNSAPSLTGAPSTAGDGDFESIPADTKPDLLDTLKQKFGPLPMVVSEQEGLVKKRKTDTPAPKPKDDYDRFLEEIGDILSPTG